MLEVAEKLMEKTKHASKIKIDASTALNSLNHQSKMILSIDRLKIFFVLHILLLSDVFLFYLIKNCSALLFAFLTSHKQH